jgi:ParB/RepB/Spo0J family partition protein
MAIENVVAEVVMIPVDRLVVGENIRTEVPKERIEAMSASILDNKDNGKNGIDEPLHVSKVNGKYEIHDGQVRFLGARHAKIESVPCIVHKIEDVGLFQIRTFLRTDPNPIEEAIAYKMNFKDIPIEQMVVATGKSEREIKRRLMLLDLVPEMQKAIQQGKISAGHGVILAQIHDKKARNNLFKMIQKDKLSVKETVERIDDVLNMTSLDNVVFDTTECKKCQYCHLDYPEMFDDGTNSKMKGVCRNFPCLIKKQVAQLEKDVSSMIKNGTQAVLYKKKQYEMNEDDMPEVKGMLSLRYEMKHKKCGLCPKKVVVMFIDGEKEIYCPDKACHKLGDVKEKKGKDEKKKEPAVKDPRKGKRIYETVFRYLRKAIADNLSWETALTVIIAEFIKNSKMQPDDYLEPLMNISVLTDKQKKKIVDSPWNFSMVEIIHPLTRKQKETLLMDVIQVYFNTKAYYEIANLEVMANTCEGKQTIKNFRVDEEYLKKMTKVGLVVLGGELSVSGLADTMKKTELVNKILAVKTDKGPKEIIEAKIEKLD